MCRFFSRYNSFAEGDIFWKDMLERKINIPSSESYIKNFQHTRKWHIEHEYNLMDAEQIYLHIENLANKE